MLLVAVIKSSLSLAISPLTLCLPAHTNVRLRSLTW